MISAPTSWLRIVIMEAVTQRESLNSVCRAVSLKAGALPLGHASLRLLMECWGI